MISDNERRDMARRLREYVDLPDDWWQETSAEFYVEKCVFGNVDRHSEAELFARLANLIEPTCDRDALLGVLDEMDVTVRYAGPDVERSCIEAWASRIREALGVDDA